MSEYPAISNTDLRRTIPADSFMSMAVSVRDPQLPPHYDMFRREMRLPGGYSEPGFYTIHVTQGERCEIDPETGTSKFYKKSAPSVIAGFVWVLETAGFADGEPINADRALEIGNIMSYGMAVCGLLESELLECYEIAYRFVDGEAGDPQPQ